MLLKQQLTNDMKMAMKAKNKNELTAIRSIIGAIKQLEIDTRIEAKDKDVLQVIQKMVKQRKDSIAQFISAKRNDLVEIEQNELAVIIKYMPAQLNESEINIAIDNVINEFNASSMADMGKIMSVLKSSLGGKTDMGIVNKILRGKLE